MVENVLQGSTELLFGSGVEIGDDETEEFLKEEIFVLILVFGVLVSESFDEYGDTGFELIYFH